MTSETVTHKPLYDLAIWKNGLAFRNIQFSPKGKPVIKIAELKNGITDQTKFTQDEFDDSVALCTGDMVFSWSGNPETSIDVFYYDLPDGWLNQHIFKVMPVDVDRSFLFYLLKYYKPTFTAIASNKQTTGLGHVTVKDLKELIVDVPPRETQRTIASTLSALDARIAENRKINHHLEQMAQAIFKSWFVDFEPFGGMMLEDWREVPLGEVVEMSTKALNPQSCPDAILEHYSIPAFDETRLPVFEAASEIKSNKYIVDKDCFLISKLNPTTKRIWRPYCISSHPVCSTEFMVYRTKNPAHKDFYYSVIDSPAFTDFLLSHITGSTGSRQRAIPSETLAFAVVVPPDDIIEDFCDKVAPVYAHFEQNHLESRRLRQIRDSLLPRLMSGELSVADIGTAK